MGKTTVISPFAPRSLPGVPPVPGVRFATAEAGIRYKGRTDLLLEFRQQASLLPRGDLSLTDVKEFTYWLFKRRLRLWDPARVASDTQRGIEQLKLLGQSMAPASDAAGLESADQTGWTP